MTDGGLRYPAEAGCSRLSGLERPVVRSEGHGDAYLALDEIERGWGGGWFVCRGNVMPVECSKASVYNRSQASSGCDAGLSVSCTYSMRFMVTPPVGDGVRRSRRRSSWLAAGIV